MQRTKVTVRSNYAETKIGVLEGHSKAKGKFWREFSLFKEFFPLKIADFRYFSKALSDDKSLIVI